MQTRDFYVMHHLVLSEEWGKQNLYNQGSCGQFSSQKYWRALGCFTTCTHTHMHVHTQCAHTHTHTHTLIHTPNVHTRTQCTHTYTMHTHMYSHTMCTHAHTMDHTYTMHTHTCMYTHTMCTHTHNVHTHTRTQCTHIYTQDYLPTSGVRKGSVATFSMYLGTLVVPSPGLTRTFLTFPHLPGGGALIVTGVTGRCMQCGVIFSSHSCNEYVQWWDSISL